MNLLSNDVDIVFNMKSYDFCKIKYIVVGDNPGKTEKEKKEYFVGNSGKDLRKFFKNNEIVSNFEEECMVFNKTFIYTSETKKLKSLKKEDTNTFNKILEFNAKQIVSYSELLNVPILVFGSPIKEMEKEKDKYLFFQFWKKLSELITKDDKVFAYYHPSRGNLNRMFKNSEKVSKKDFLSKGKKHYKKILLAIKALD